MSKIRKALVAAGATGLTTLLTGLLTEVPRTEAGWVMLVFAAAGAALVAGRATWRIPNSA